MKLKLIPDYNREVDTVFLVSPLGLRDSAWGDFVKFLRTILSIIKEKNKEQKIVICCYFDSVEKTESLLCEEGIKNNDTIRLLSLTVLDIWIRDYFSCANIDLGGEIGVLKAVYAPNYNQLASVDDAAGQCLAQTFFDNVINILLKLDGGNVICNSEYIFISEKIYTENLGISKKEIDKFFEETFEQKLITLPTEVLDVVGHTDCILRFLDDKTIALPIYDSEYKIDNRYVMNIKRILSEKLGLNYKFVFLPSYLDDSINEDNIFSARGLFLNYFRFEDHIIFPEFQDLGYYQNRIIENMRKYAPDIKIHFSPCDDIAFYGGCFNCISNFKYR